MENIDRELVYVAECPTGAIHAVNFPEKAEKKAEVTAEQAENK